MKILVLGYKCSGKDEFAKKLSKITNLRYSNASLIAVKEFIFYSLSEKYNYKTIEDCLNDKDNHREEWAKLFNEYTADDKTKFVKKVLKTSDFYVGLRDLDQALFCLHLFDIVVWVDGCKRTGFTESSDYFTVTPKLADVIIDNNGDIENLQHQILNFKNNYINGQ